MQTQGIPQLLQYLGLEPTTISLTTQQQQAFNKLDKAWTSIRQEAEARCHKIHAGKIPWTPVVTQAIQRVLYWKGILKQVSNGKTSTTVLKWRAKQGVTFSNLHFHLPKPTIMKNIQGAYSDLKQVKEQSDWQDTWLGKMVQAQAEACN